MPGKSPENELLATASVQGGARTDPGGEEGMGCGVRGAAEPVRGYPLLRSGESRQRRAGWKMFKRNAKTSIKGKVQD